MLLTVHHQLLIWTNSLKRCTMFNNTVRDPTQRKQLQLVQLSSYKWQKSQSRVATGFNLDLLLLGWSSHFLKTTTMLHLQTLGFRCLAWRVRRCILAHWIAYLWTCLQVPRWIRMHTYWDAFSWSEFLCIPVYSLAYQCIVYRAYHTHADAYSSTHGVSCLALPLIRCSCRPSGVRWRRSKICLLSRKVG